MVEGGWGEKECGVTGNGYRVSFWGDERGLELDCGDGGPTL